MQNITSSQLDLEIVAAEKLLCEPDGRASRLWGMIKICPSRWAQSQYDLSSSFWVIALLGKRCMYLNHVEGGWGWGQFEPWGTISSYHYQGDEIHHAVFQTLLAIENGWRAKNLVYARLTVAHPKLHRCVESSRSLTRKFNVIETQTIPGTGRRSLNPGSIHSRYNTFSARTANISLQPTPHPARLWQGQSRADLGPPPRR